MKSAEEWVKDSEGKWDVEYVRAIQADVLRYCGSTFWDKASFFKSSGDARMAANTMAWLANELINLK